MNTIKITFAKDCIPRHHVVDHGFLETPQFFDYDENTRIVDLFRYLFDKSGLFFYEESICYRDGKGNWIEENNGRMEVTDAMLLELFLIEYKNDYVSIWNGEAKVKVLFDFIGVSDSITVYYEPSFGGEGYFKGVECKGIQFYFHSQEKVHQGRPHVHAFKNDDEITIDLNTYDILVGHFRKKKDETQAVECVKNHQMTFMQAWNDCTNGIYVDLTKYSDLVSE